MPQNLPVALTIAGYDPSGGAGITADLAVFAAHGLTATSATTILTAQSTQGVAATLEVEPDFVRQTLSVLAADFVFSGVKIGALGSGAVAHVVAEFLQKLPADVPRVLDPVLLSTSGKALFPPDELADLLAVAAQTSWVTPNEAELAALTRLPVGSPREKETAARALQGKLPGLGVVVTGGESEAATDLVVVADGSVETLTGERVDSRSTHGTGCAFSTAMLCGLIRGLEPVDAARAAKAFVAEGIRRGPAVGSGRGPLDLYWPLR
jgi:hydroxymethylpyrimidine/phosphomethylpyrimidine kinase